MPAPSGSLQAGTGSNLGNANASSFQPGIAADQLRSSNGIDLTPKPLSTISLNQAGSGATQTTPPKADQFNPVLMIVAATLFLLAVAMFTYISKTGKQYND